MGVPQDSWFILENPTTKDDDWGYPYFRKPPDIKKYVMRKLSPLRLDDSRRLDIQVITCHARQGTFQAAECLGHSLFLFNGCFMEWTLC